MNIITQHLQACLPYLSLSNENTVFFGPLSLWSSVQFKKNLPDSLHSSFQKFLSLIGVDNITCLSLSEEIPREKIMPLIIDTLYLLYFATIFRPLYYDSEIPNFKGFTKITPVNTQLLFDQNLDQIYEKREKKSEKIVCLGFLDEDICHAFGKIISESYGIEKTSEEKKEQLIHLTHSIRYFVDRFFEQFTYLSEKNSISQFFIPENLLFLGTSFDILLNINELYSSSDFKQKARQMLHLEHSRPIELLWRWVEGFYTLRKKVLYGAEPQDFIFKANHSFEVPYLYMANKLYIYLVYYTLFRYKLIHGKEINIFTPPDFTWIHPEEILQFFWTEDNLLRKLSINLRQIITGEEVSVRIPEARMLSRLYIQLYHKYFISKPLTPVIFYPSDLSLIEEYIKTIQRLCIEKIPIYQENLPLFELLPEELVAVITERLKIT